MNNLFTKTRVALLALVAAVPMAAIAPAMADEGRYISLTTIRQDTCDYWTNVRVGTQSIYGCMLRPRQADTIEAMSLKMALDRIDQRITDIETRVKALENP